MVDERAGELVTANYGWTKPTVGASDDQWGGYLNADLDGIDSTVKSVSTVANAAYPASNPAGYITASAIPAPYVLPTASTSVLGGVKVDGTTVAISGGGVISAAGSVAVSAIAPSSPVQGSLWFDTNGGQMYVWYNDGTSSQWVSVVNQGSSASAVSSVPLIVPPPVAASWTQRNFIGTTTLTDVANGVALFAQSATSGVTNILRAATIPAPATPYVIDMNFSVIASAAGGGNYIKGGAVWSDGTKAQHIFAGALASGLAFSIENYTNFNSYAGAVSGLNGFTLYNTQSFWIRIADNGTTISVWYGPDDISWFLLYSVAKASGFLGASGYTNVGISVNEQVLGLNGQIIATLKSWWVH